MFLFIQFLLLVIRTNKSNKSNLTEHNTFVPTGIQETSHENPETEVVIDTIQETPIPFQRSTEFDIDDVIYIVFDIETTGYSRVRHSIIKTACIMLDSNGDVILD
jgi:uncharacterized protein YprB with RNaseH-like and TPR domain